MDVDIGSAVALSAIAWKITSFVKFLLAYDWTSAKSQATVWIGGIVVAFLAAQADVATGTKIGEYTLSTLDWQSLVLLGLTVGSFAGVGYDLKKAVDNSDTAEEPAFGVSVDPPV